MLKERRRSKNLIRIGQHSYPKQCRHNTYDSSCSNYNCSSGYCGFFECGIDTEIQKQAVHFVYAQLRALQEK